MIACPEDIWTMAYLLLLAAQGVVNAILSTKDMDCKICA